ncbi:MAG TPA: protease modulator HflC [Gammaproteobacteria bacterium]|nr:protease modulator HflC [Gammaproteobacteria bacterium]
MKSLGVLAAVLLLVIAGFSVFTVKETEKAVLLRLGEIVRTDYEPGLHFKVPFINNVRTFDSRILTLDVESERYLTSEKKNVIVDAFVKWRIADVAAFYKAAGGDERQGALRLSQIIKDSLRGEFGKRTIQEVVSGERSMIMNLVTVNANKQAQEFGIKLVDVRLKRIDLPEAVSEAVYRRMEAERSRVARELRSEGSEEAERIRADADRRRTEIVANAYRDAERARGEGDAKAAEIYAAAFDQDREFFSFYRSLQAYRNTFNSANDVLVIDPKADFFKYFNQQRATVPAAPQP